MPLSKYGQRALLIRGAVLIKWTFVLSGRLVRPAALLSRSLVMRWSKQSDEEKRRWTSSSPPSSLSLSCGRRLAVNPRSVLSCSSDTGHSCQPPWHQWTSATIDQVTQCTAKGKQHFLQQRRGPRAAREKLAMRLTPGWQTLWTQTTGN